MENKDKEKGWYPGKYAHKIASKRNSLLKAGQSGHNSPVIANPLPNQDHVDYDTAYEDASINTDKFTRNVVEKVPINKKIMRSTVHDQMDSRVIGTVAVKIEKIKYLNISYPARLRIHLDEDYAQKEITGTDENSSVFDETFNITEITSDILIFLEGKSFLNEVGDTKSMIIIPLVSKLSLFGKVIAAKSEWKQLFPVYGKFRTKESAIVNKYISGFPDLGGFALTKPKEPIGFMQIKIEVNLKISGFQCYFRPIQEFPKILEIYHENSFDHHQETFLELSDEMSESVMTAIFHRNQTRLRRLLTPPSFLAALLAFPDVFVLVALNAFLCLSVDTWQLPLFLFSLILFNGILTNMNRSYKHVILWNDPIPCGTVPNPVTNAPSSTTTNKTSPSMSKKSFNSVNCFMNYTLSVAEILLNLFAFGDGRISIIFYAILFVLSAFIGIVFLLGQMRLVIFLGISAALIVGGCFEYFVELFEFLTTQTEGQIDAMNVKILKTVTRLVQVVVALLRRIPDEMELTHRHMCTLSTRTEESAEMMDQAAIFAKRNAEAMKINIEPLN